MPDLTTKLGLKKPLGNETVSRLAYNENLDLIDANVASQTDLDEHKNAVDPHPQYKKDTDAPISHASSHASGGTDPITPTSIDAAPLSHVGTGGTAHAVVTTLVNGFMTATDKTKLDGIETGATADQTASEILTLLKTVDGVGSGLDAHSIQGLLPSAFYAKNNNIYFLENREYAGNEIYTKRIVLGDNYKSGIAILRSQPYPYKGALIHFNTNVDSGASLASDSITDKKFHIRKAYNDYVIYSSDAFNGSSTTFRLRDMYIDGGDLVLVIINGSSSVNTTNYHCEVNVWG